MITFRSLHIKNFCSFKEQIIPLDKKGIILVLGDNKDETQADSNGSGKSLILEAFCWALWGETIRGESNDNLVNNKVNKNCVISIEFIKDDLHYKVIRHHKDKQHSKENDVELFINDKNETLEKITSTQSLINSIIGLDFDSFSCLMPGARVKVSQLTDKGFKELLENFTKLNLFEAAHAKAKAKVVELTTLKNTLEHNITTARVRMEAYDKSIEAIDKQYALDVEHQQHRLNEINSELLSLVRIDDAMARDQLAFTEESKTHTSKYIITLCNQLAIIDKNYYDDNLLKDLLVKFKEKKADLISQIREISSLQGSCPKCLQTLDETHSQKMLPKLEKKLQSIEKNIQTTIESLEKKSEEWQALRREKNVSIEREQDNLKSHQYKINELNKNISEAKYKNKLIDNLELNKEIFSKPVVKPEFESWISMKEKTQLSIDSDFDKLKEVEKELKIAEFWLEAFSAKGLRSYILRNVTPFINKRLNYYCNYLTGGSMQVSIRTERVLKNGNIKDDFGIDSFFKNGAKTYKGCSEGEKARVDLVLSLAMADLVQNWINVTIPIRFYDEAFERVDQSGLGAIVRLLKEDQSKYDTIFVITHNINFQNFFEEKLIVTKQNGESTIWH